MMYWINKLWRSPLTPSYLYKKVIIQMLSEMSYDTKAFFTKHNEV